MAKLYGKFLALSNICENKPKFGLTKQTWTDTPFIIRGKNEDIPVWHYILVPFNNIHLIKNKQIGDSIDTTQFGEIIKYIDDQGNTHSMSGWGTEPPQFLHTWFLQHYDCGHIDENIELNYTNDDIRLCTIQRITSDQFIGIYRRYNKQNNFHYIELFDDYKSTLAYRSGIRNFDRFICLNDINIEQDTFDQITTRFDNQLDLPIQMLVCSPATYHYYKSNNLILHPNLPTVQHLKPVFDMSLSGENTSELTNCFIDQYFCVVQLDNTNIVCIVPQSSIFKSPNFIHLNDTCFVEIEQKYQRGKILFKGSQNQCENFKNNFIVQLHNNTIDASTSHCEINNHRLISKANIDDTNCKKSQFEDLPNELLFDIFDNLTLDNLHNAFSNLNYRFTNLLFSSHNISLILNENTNPLLIKLYGFKIKHLIIDTSNECDLSQFSNLHSLTLLNRNINNIKQIRPEIVPNLINLSFLLKSDFKPPNELINDIFSNRFSHIHYINLGYIDKYSSKYWLKCSSIKILSIRCNDTLIIEDILASCSNLSHLQIHFLYNIHMSSIKKSSLSFIHSLERLTIWSDNFELSIDIIDNILCLMPNIQRLYLQTICRISFIKLIENIINRLQNLSRFDCFIKELISNNNRIDILNNIYKISSCFKSIKCIKENEYLRIFSTE